VTWGLAGHVPGPCSVPSPYHRTHLALVDRVGQGDGGGGDANYGSELWQALVATDLPGPGTLRPRGTWPHAVGLGSAFLWPWRTRRSTSSGDKISFRKRSCWSSSRARRVGPGWLESERETGGMDQQGRTPRQPTGWRGGHALEELCVRGRLEVLQVGEVGDELGLVEHLLLGQMVEVDGVGQTLDKLGWMS